MLYRIGAWVVTLGVSTVAGVSLGNATVAQMAVRARPIADDSGAADRSFDRGMRWARSHGILSSNDCPDPDQYFLSGCVAATSSDG